MMSSLITYTHNSVFVVGVTSAEFFVGITFALTKGTRGRIAKLFLLRKQQTSSL
jgi:hypothetical protein